MTRPNSALVLRRASERLTAGAAALALTCLTLLTVDVRASEPEPVPAKVLVHYSDTAFDSVEGAASVYRKLRTAARRVADSWVRNRAMAGETDCDSSGPW